jgi:hypothetical protein
MIMARITKDFLVQATDTEIVILDGHGQEITAPLQAIPNIIGALKYFARAYQIDIDRSGIATYKRDYGDF